jgi:predicted porin
MKLSAVALSLTVGCCGIAHASSDADEPASLSAAPPTFSFGGFGTFGFVHSSRHDGDFAASTFKPNGAGFSHDWSSDVDSLIAAQITANFTRQWSAVVQVVSQQNAGNSYKPAVEWANVKFQANDALDVRLGRTPLPAFMVTDTRMLGYANPWVRPPVELYALVPVTQNDGIDASYRNIWGAGTNTVHLTVGRSNSDFPLYAGAGSSSVRGRRQFVLTDLYERGFASVRVNYSTAHVTIDGFNPLFASFDAFGPQGVAIADRFSFHDRTVSFYSVGASYDPQDWFVMAEWGHINTGPFTGDNTGWYATGGYRFHTLTPYVTYSRASTSTSRTNPGLTVANLPPAAAATQLNGILASALETIRSQHTVSLGARWDFVRNVAAKVQFDHTLVDAGSDAQVRNLQPNYPTGGTLNLISVSVDFVF